MAPTISYAQRFEDLYLMRCFGERAEGFYIDIGSGHPVYDNVSFAFYLRGWHGITVEPNPWLSRLSRAVRPRDRHVEALVGAACEPAATFYLVNEFHGLSTMFEPHAQAALTQFGKSAQAITVPLTTLRTLCQEGHAPASFDFLKVDVEGAEPAVLFGGDWERFRPTKPALGDQGHPDHRLAVQLGNAIMTRLPVLDRGLLVEFLTAGLDPA